MSQDAQLVLVGMACLSIFPILWVVSLFRLRKGGSDYNIRALHDLGIKDWRQLTKVAVAKIYCRNHQMPLIFVQAARVPFVYGLSNTLARHTEVVTCPLCNEAITLEIDPNTRGKTRINILSPGKHKLKSQFASSEYLIPNSSWTTGIRCYQGKQEYGLRDVKYWIGDAGQVQYKVAPLTFQTGDVLTERVEKYDCPICNRPLHFSIYGKTITVLDQVPKGVSVGGRYVQVEPHALTKWDQK